MAFATPTAVYVVDSNADLKALQNASHSASVATEVAFYDTLKAAGASTAEAATRANPDNTEKLVTFAITTTGTTTEAMVEAIVRPYVNGLALGADVDASVMSDAILALATTTLVTVFELSLDADPTGETIDLTIGAAEVAYTTVLAIVHTAA